MLELEIYQVVDHIKNGDIDPIQAVNLRGEKFCTIFEFSVRTWRSAPMFDTRLFSIVHETSVDAIRNGTLDTFLDACVNALMSQLEKMETTIP